MQPVGSQICLDCRSGCASDQDKQTLSDLAGQDPRIHGNDPKAMVSLVRAFLRAKAPSGSRTRGADAIWARYQDFARAVPALAKALGISKKEIVSFDYLSDWISVMVAWLARSR